MFGSDPRNPIYSLREGEWICCFCFEIFDRKEKEISCPGCSHRKDFGTAHLEKFGEIKYLMMENGRCVKKPPSFGWNDFIIECGMKGKELFIDRDGRRMRVV
jgi:hypothetical protein